MEHPPYIIKEGPINFFVFYAAYDELQSMYEERLSHVTLVVPFNHKAIANWISEEVDIPSVEPLAFIPKDHDWWGIYACSKDEARKHIR